jgi:hypothetical protein
VGHTWWRRHSRGRRHTRGELKTCEVRLGEEKLARTWRRRHAGHPGKRKVSSLFEFFDSLVYEVLGGVLDELTVPGLNCSLVFPSFIVRLPY